MSSVQSINTPQDYVNYTFNVTSRGLTEVTSEFAGASSTISNLLGLMAFKTSEYLTHTEAMITGMAFAATAAFASATQEAIKFEQAIANVQAIGGESINASIIGEKAMQFSNQLGMNVDSMTEGLEALARAGITATDVMSGVLEEGVKLSKLEGLDLEDSINDLISTTNLLAETSIDVNSDEYATAVQQMNQHIVSTSESAPINAQNIIQSLQHVGGYVSANKIDQDDLFAVIAQLGSKGTKGEMAGTALRAFVAAGQKDQAQRALARIGLDPTDLWDASGEAMLPISEMKQVLDNALEARGYSKQEKLEFYSDFVGYKQANQVMKINTSEVQEYKNTIASAWDLGTKLNVILGTANNNILTLFQTVKNFMTKVGSNMLPIINAIVIPIKWTMQLIEKIPFSDKIVGIGMAFLGLKGVLLIINQVVPALASLYTSANHAEEKTKGIRGHIKSIVNDLKEAKEVINNVNDRDFLAQKRLNKDLFGKQSAELHKSISIELYNKVKTPVDKDFFDLPRYAQERWYEYADALQNTPMYEDIKNQKMSDIKMFIPLGHKIKSSNLDKNNKENIEKKASSDIVKELKDMQNNSSITKAVSEMKKYQIALDNTIKRNIDKGRDVQFDIGKGIMSIAKPFSEILVDTYISRTSVKTQDIGHGISVTASNQATSELQDIQKTINIDLLPDMGFEFNDNADEMKKALKQLEHEIQRTVTDFSNVNIESVNEHQLRTTGKSLSLSYMNNTGLQYSINRNEADIRHAVTTGKWLDPRDTNKSIRPEQLDSIERILQITSKRDKYDRAGRISDINKKYQSLGKDQKTEYLQTIIAATKGQWIEFLNTRKGPSADKTSNINIDDATAILKAIEVPIDTTTNAVEQLQKVAQHFKDTGNYSMLNYIQTLLFSSQKNDTYGTFSKNETDELKYMIEHYLMIQKGLDRVQGKKESVADNEDLDFSYEIDEFGSYINEFGEYVNGLGFILPDLKEKISSSHNERIVYGSLENFIHGTKFQMNRHVNESSLKYIWEDFLQNILINQETLSKGRIGMSWGNQISVDAQQIKDLYPENAFVQVLGTLIHESAHSILQHHERQRNEGMDGIYTGNAEIRPEHNIEGYKSGNIVSELEANVIAAQVLSGMGMEVPQLISDRIDEFQTIYTDYNLSGLLSSDVLKQLSNYMVSNQDFFIDIARDMVQHTQQPSILRSLRREVGLASQNPYQEFGNEGHTIEDESQGVTQDSEYYEGISPQDDINFLHESLKATEKDLYDTIQMIDVPMDVKRQLYNRMKDPGNMPTFDELFRIEDQYIEQRGGFSSRGDFRDIESLIPKPPDLKEYVYTDKIYRVHLESFNTDLLTAFSQAFEMAFQYEEQEGSPRSVLQDMVEAFKMISNIYDIEKQPEDDFQKDIKKIYSSFMIRPEDIETGYNIAKEQLEQAKYDDLNNKFGMFTGPLIGNPDIYDESEQQHLSVLIGQYMGATITNQLAGTTVLRALLEKRKEEEAALREAAEKMENVAKLMGEVKNAMYPSDVSTKMPLLEAGESILQIAEISTAQGKELNKTFEDLIFNMKTASEYFAKEDWQNQPMWAGDARHPQWNTTIDTYVSGIPDNANIMRTPPVIMDQLVNEMLIRKETELGRELSKHEKKYWSNQVRKNYANMDANTGILYYTGPEVDDTALKQEQDRIKREQQYNKVTSMPNVFGKYFNQLPDSEKLTSQYKITIWDALADIYGEDVLDIIARQNIPIEKNLPILQGLGIHDLKSTGYEELRSALVELYGEERVSYGEGERKSLQQLLNLHAYEMMKYNANADLRRRDNFDEKRKAALKRDEQIQKSNLLGRAFGHNAKGLSPTTSYVDIVDAQFNNSELDELSQSYAILEASGNLFDITKEMLGGVMLFNPSKIISDKAREREEFLTVAKLMYPELFKQVMNMSLSEQKQFRKDFETGNLQTIKDIRLADLQKQYPGQFKMVSSFSEEKQKELAESASNMPMHQIARALTSAESNLEELSIINDIIKALIVDDNSYESTSSVEIDTSDKHNDAFDEVRKKNEALQQQKEDLQRQIEHEQEILNQVIDDINYSAFTDAIDEIKESIQLKADIISIIARGNLQHEEIIMEQEIEKERQKLEQAFKDAEEIYQNTINASTPVMGAHLVTPEIIETAQAQINNQQINAAQQRRSALLQKIQNGEYIPIAELEAANLHGWIEIQKERNAEFYKNNITNELPLVGMGLTPKDVRTRNDNKLTTQEDVKDSIRVDAVQKAIDEMSIEEAKEMFNALKLKKQNTGTNLNRSEKFALKALQNKINEEELVTQTQIAEEKMHQERVKTAQEIKAQKQKELDDAYAESQRQTEIRKKWLQKLIYTYKNFGQAGIGQILRFEDMENDEQIYIVDFLQKQKKKEQQQMEDARNENIMKKVREDINKKETLKEEGEKLWADIERQEVMSQDLIRIRTEEDLKNNKMLFDALNQGRNVDDWAIRVMSNLKTDTGKQDFINNILKIAKQNNEIATPLFDYFTQNASTKDIQTFIQQSLDSMRSGQQIPQQYVDFILNSDESSEYQKQQMRSYEKINQNRIKEEQNRNARKQMHERDTPYNQRLRQKAWEIRLKELESNNPNLTPDMRRDFKKMFYEQYGAEDAWKVKKQELIDRGEWDILSQRQQQNVHDIFAENFNKNQRYTITSLNELQQKQLEAQKEWLQEVFALKDSGQWQTMNQSQRQQVREEFITNYMDMNYALTYELRQQLEQQKIQDINAELERQKTEEYKEIQRLKEEELARIREEKERILRNIETQDAREKGWNTKEQTEARLKQEEENLKSVQKDLFDMVMSPAVQEARKEQDRQQGEKLAKQAKKAGVDNLHIMGVGVDDTALKEQKAQKEEQERIRKEQAESRRKVLDSLHKADNHKYENIDKEREINRKRAENFKKMDEREEPLEVVSMGSGMFDYHNYMNDMNNLIPDDAVLVDDKGNKIDTTGKLTQEEFDAKYQEKYKEHAEAEKTRREEKSRKEQERLERLHQAQRERMIRERIEPITNIIEDGANKISSFLDNSALGSAEDNINVFSETAEKINDTVNPLREFNNALSKVAATFPILTPLVIGINTILGVTRGVVEGLQYAELALMTIRIAGGTATEEMAEKEGYKVAKEWADKIKKYAGEDSWITKSLGKMGEWGTKGANLLKATVKNGIEYISGLSMSVILPVVAIFTAIAATIAGLWIWEKRHAAALKETQEALEEASNKQQAAVLTYENAKKARENETDAIKKQQAARREAIALYELETARIQKRKAVHEEAKVRGDAIWGEYGLRASLQKMGLGFIAGGDFESQYENYDGTTKNIRQIKENTLGNLFATSEQKQIANLYDSNKMFFAEVEAYKQPLQELYDKESKLIEQYGSIDLARGTKEFEDAVQEFADATGINGETAVKMLDWLQTENKVNQATQVAKASIGLVRARADAKAMGMDLDTNGLDDMDDIGKTMVYAQVDQIINDEKHEMWWTMLWEYLQAIISALLPWKWGDVNKHLSKAGAYQEGVKELEQNRQKYYDEALKYYENADRKDYGTDVPLYADTPFGWATEENTQHFWNKKTKEDFIFKNHAEKEKQHQNIKQNNVYSKQNAENISKMRKKDNIVPIQKEILYYQRKNSQFLEEGLKQDKEQNSHKTAARAAGAVAGQSLYYLSKRPIGAKGAVKTPTRVLAHMLAPDDVDMPGASIWNKIFKKGKDTEKIASKSGKGLKSGGDVIEMEAKGGKYVAKEGTEKIGKEGAEKVAAKTIGKTLGKALPLIGPAVTAAFSIAEHNPFETHYNEDGSEKRALQSTGEVVGEVGGSLLAAGLGLAATAVGGPIAGAVVEFGASLILEPLGKAIGGVLGWLGDELINGLAGSVSAVWDGLTNAAGSIWDTVSGTATGIWDWISGGVTNTINGTIDWLTGDSKSSNAYTNITSDSIQQKTSSPNHNDNTTIVIENININTEDDPEKIKTAFMNLMIELEEQITPRQVSRVIGQSNNNQTNQNVNSDIQNTEQESTNQNTNNNPTV